MITMAMVAMSVTSVPQTPATHGLLPTVIVPIGMPLLIQVQLKSATVRTIIAMEQWMKVVR